MRKPKKWWGAVGGVECVVSGGERLVLHRIVGCLTESDCRRLSAWLLRAADWIAAESKKKEAAQ